MTKAQSVTKKDLEKLATKKDLAKQVTEDRKKIEDHECRITLLEQGVAASV